MPRTNSEDDFGGSLTSDASEDEFGLGPSSPIQATTAFGDAASKGPGRLNTDIYSNPTEAIVGKDGNPRTPPPLKSPKSPKSQAVRSPKSARSFPRHSVSDGPLLGDSVASTLKGADRFRHVVKKVMQMHRTTTSFGAFGGAGAEPGIDPRRTSATLAYGHIREACSIQVVDYSSVQSKFQTFDNKSFVEFLNNKKASARPDRSKVRWIAIGGISWDVISSLALAYDLHPLSLEDVLHRRHGHIRSKADYYSRHLFIRLLCHTLGNPSDDPLDIAPVMYQSTNITDAPRSMSPGGYDFNEKGDENGDISSGGSLPRRRTTMMSRKETKQPDIEHGPKEELTLLDRTDSTTEALLNLEELKSGQRVNVIHRNFFTFLMRDGTLISIHQTPSAAFFAPIMARLRTRDTVLRTTADASLLLQSLLDLIVDQAMEIVEEYRKTILKLESNILLKPKMKSVRQLHILSGDLSAHKLTIEPIKPLIYGLRRYDLDRCIAVAVSSADTAEEAAAETKKVTGYMSHKSKVYLADVHDHVEYIISSLEMFAGVSENLINYTFNMASYQMNEVMRVFTLVTIIFLPLTFLSGYFGMNFNQDHFPALHHGDIFFWEVALPILAVVIPIFMWSDIIRGKHYVEKHYLRRSTVPTRRF